MNSLLLDTYLNSAGPFSGDCEWLGRTLEERVLQAQQAWPQLGVEPLAFAAHLGRRCPPSRLPTAHIEDLYLAFGCCVGDPTAQRLVDERWLLRVGKELSTKRPFTAVADDAIAILREKLLFGANGQKPKLAEFAGEGSLLALIRAAALRTAMNVKRAQLSSDQVEVVDESVTLLDGDPEMAFLKSSYRAPFSRAFRQALASLPDERVNVLRLNLLDGLNIEKIGVLYQCHRSTIARWIAEARQTLLTQTRLALAQELNLGPQEFDSVVRLLRSQLDVSLRKALEERT